MSRADLKSQLYLPTSTDQVLTLILNLICVDQIIPPLNSSNSYPVPDPAYGTVNYCAWYALLTRPLRGSRTWAALKQPLEAPGPHITSSAPARCAKTRTRLWCTLPSSKHEEYEPNCEQVDHICCAMQWRTIERVSLRPIILLVILSDYLLYFFEDIFSRTTPNFKIVQP